MSHAGREDFVFSCISPLSLFYLPSISSIHHLSIFYHYSILTFAEFTLASRHDLCYILIPKL